MKKESDFSSLEADLEGKKADVVRERTNVMLSALLKEQVRIAYPNRSLGSVLEEGALMKLRTDGYLKTPETKPEPKSFVEDKIGQLAEQARARRKTTK